jgi:para-nitrobenzyl esterase
MAIATIGGAVSSKPVSGFAKKSTTEYVEVKTAYGRIRGLRQGNLVTFKGIPYAGSVSEANRFRAAPPLQPWTGVKDALRLGAPSWQPGKSYYGINEPSPDENCLFLNIWSPAADGRKRPVMFYNHGGGFFKGSGGALYQDEIWHVSTMLLSWRPTIDWGSWDICFWAIWVAKNMQPLPTRACSTSRTV